MSTNNVSEPVSGSQTNHPDPLIARPSTPRFNRKRVLSALVLLPLLYVLNRHLPPVAFFVFIALIVLVAQWEFLGLFFEKHHLPQHALVSLPGTLLLLLAMQWPAVFDFSLTLSIIFVSLLCYQVGFAPAESRHLVMVVMLFGILYVGYTLGHVLWLKEQLNGTMLIFFLMLVTWAGDTAAYYVGRRRGSRPLAPQLSPKKTVEGFLGGLIVAPLIAWLGHVWFLPAVTLLESLVLGVLFTVLGLLGDLSESALKRYAGAKDSGTLIPGHGGMLDRVDSLLLNAPVFYYYMTFVH